MTDLFDYQADRMAALSRPLAEQMRPRNLAAFVGQPQVAGPDGPIRKAIEQDRIFSMILWGPPGCGKTTLASIIARETSSYFVQISAVLSGVKEIRQVINLARQQRQLYQKRTLLFVDEIHRFNKAQQDAFLHHVESGLLTLIGATTENPSFEVIPALISRCRVVVLNPVPAGDIAGIVETALTDTDYGLGKLGLTLSPEALDYLVADADGDVRRALNNLELAAAVTAEKSPVAGESPPPLIDLGMLETALQYKALRYDKSGEDHYNLISAFHKSLRGSDPDAALYWLTRMLDSGEDPLYVGRRMVRFASEDVGIADPYALRMTLDALEAFRFLGHPEGDLALKQAAVYLATAPKSNAVYAADKAVRETVKQAGALPVPLHIRNAPTRLMKHLGYGRDYKYAHDDKSGFTPQEYLPEALDGTLFYHPSSRGYERTVKDRLDKWRERKARAAVPQAGPKQETAE